MKNIRVVGFGSTAACLSPYEPPPSFGADLEHLRALFVARGVKRPVVSVGGSYFFAWVSEHRRTPITEVRFGDPFILGEDIYRGADFPGGSFRQYVCSFVAEVLEIRWRHIDRASEAGRLRHVDGQAIPREQFQGLRLRALLDAGRFPRHFGILWWMW